MLEVLHYPHPVLKIPAAFVDLHHPELVSFAHHLVLLMNSQPRCVGIAAPQVGKSWRLFVADASRVEKPGSAHGLLIVMNPTLVLGEKKRVLREGCLSVPDFTGNVLRSETVLLQGVDLHGKAVSIEAYGFEAEVIQHEVDHLDGKLFLDRVSSVETDVFRRKKYI